MKLLFEVCVLVFVYILCCHAKYISYCESLKNMFRLKGLVCYTLIVNFVHIHWAEISLRLRTSSY